VRRQALHGERPGDADALRVLVRLVVEEFRVGVSADGGVYLLARHALADVRVVGDGLQRDVWDALVDEAAADVTPGVLVPDGGQGFGPADLPARLDLLPDALGRVGEQEVRVLRGHEARAGEGQRHAARVNRDPPPPPLLGYIRRRPRPARRIEHQVTRVGGHKETALNGLRSRLDDIGLVFSEATRARVWPEVDKRIDREVVDEPHIPQSLAGGHQSPSSYQRLHSGRRRLPVFVVSGLKVTSSQSNIDGQRLAESR
jgi:hypothetical protein